MEARSRTHGSASLYLGSAAPLVLLPSWHSCTLGSPSPTRGLTGRLCYLEEAWAVPDGSPGSAAGQLVRATTARVPPGKLPNPTVPGSRKHRLQLLSSRSEDRQGLPGATEGPTLCIQGTPPDTERVSHCHWPSRCLFTRSCHVQCHVSKQPRHPQTSAPASVARGHPPAATAPTRAPGLS